MTHEHASDTTFPRMFVAFYLAALLCAAVAAPPAPVPPETFDVGAALTHTGVLHVAESCTQ
jgi:hypothetical protein